MKVDTLKQHPKARIRQVWICKTDIRCYVMTIAYKTIVPNSRYFDNGYSKYMIGNRSMLTNFKTHT